MQVYVWTRVEVNPNPGKAGVGIVLEAYSDGVLVGEKEIQHAFNRLTNYQAEIEAVTLALHKLIVPSVVTVYSTSQPFVLSAKKLPDASGINAERTAFEALSRLIIEAGHTVTFEHRKANSELNFDLAKMLAQQAHGGVK